MVSVAVVLSSFNGEKFISAQIDSILKQEGVDVTLLIRDDGSTDRTVEIVEKFVANYKNIKLIKGNNIGFAASFLQGIKELTSTYDFYAFSDQDDIWMKDKLLIAINGLNGIDSNSKCLLYASGLHVVDENLNFLYEHTFKGIKISMGSALSRQRLAGCTMVFNYKLYELISKIDVSCIKKCKLSHDGLVYFSCLMCGGQVKFEPYGRIMYRRHDGTVTENGKGLIKKIQTIFRIFGKDKAIRREQLQMLVSICDTQISEESRKLANLILEYPQSFRKKMRLIWGHDINCGIAIVDLVNKIAILFGSY